MNEHPVSNKRLLLMYQQYISIQAALNQIIMVCYFSKRKCKSTKTITEWCLILQEMKTSPKSDIFPFCIKAFNLKKNSGIILKKAECNWKKGWGVILVFPTYLTCLYEVWYPFLKVGGESHCESKVSFPRTHCNALARSQTWTAQII